MSEDPYNVPRSHATVPPSPASAPLAPAPQRSIALIVLGIIVGVQAVVILGLVVVVASFGFFAPFGMTMMDDEAVWIATEDVAFEVRALLEQGDVDRYVALYRADDPHVDLERVTRDFELAAERVEGRQDSFDVYPGMWEVFVDAESGERLMRVDLDVSDWASGRSITRLRVWVSLDANDAPVVLTGNVGRDLEMDPSYW